MNELKWFVIYVYPRTEFIVKNELSLRKYEFFFPEIEELKVWKNRQKKIIKKPLFPGYIFVKTYYHELYKLITIPKVCYFLSTGGKATPIPEYQVELIKDNITSQKDFYINNNTDDATNKEAIVLSGPLKGYKGKLVSKKGKDYLGVDLDFVNKRLWINVQTNCMKII